MNWSAFSSSQHVFAARTQVLLVHCSCCDDNPPKHKRKWLVRPFFTRITNCSAQYRPRAILAAAIPEERDGIGTCKASVIDCTGSICDKQLDLDQLLDDQARLAALASLLRRCGKFKALSDGRRVHAYISRYGFHGNTFLGNCLLQMYGNCGSIEDARAMFEKIHDPNLFSWSLLTQAYVQNGNLEGARSIFNRMPQQDVVSWTAMIAAYAQNGHSKEAMDLFKQMLRAGVNPNKITFVSVLDACANLEALQEGQEIHAAIVDWGCEQDIVVGTNIVNMYGKCGMLEDAKRVFWRSTEKDIITWSAMITALAQNGSCREALDLFYHMQLDGVKPDIIIFICALDACSSLAALEEGHKICTAAVKRGFEQSVAIGNALVNVYGKCGSLADASSIFDKMPHRNVISWTTLISVSVFNGQSKKGLDLFWKMQFDGINPDKITFVCTLDACASLEALEIGRKIHVVIIDRQHEGDIAVGSALINMYGKCGSLDDARNVLGRMPLHCVDSWNTMIGVCAQHGHGKEALQLFNQMLLEGAKPDKVTFSAALDACTELAALKEGQEIHASVIEKGFEQDYIVGTAIVNMYGKCGSLDVAKRVFYRMLWRDIVSWNAIITACAHNGHSDEVLELFNNMHFEGVKPNAVTFLCVLAACSHTGQVENARNFFVSMKRDHGITHTVEHYMCIIDLLGRAGHLDEAEELVSIVPFESIALAWLSVLGACRIHGDAKRGIRAASHCFLLDPENAASYVALSNIYAAGNKGEMGLETNGMNQHCDATVLR